MKKFGLLLGILCALVITPAFAEVKTGDPAPDFTLVDTDGNTHVLSTYQGKYVILEWFNSDCPFVKKHYESQNMQNLQKEMIGKDVAWLLINSSAEGKQGHYSAEELNQILAKWGSHPTAAFSDSDGKVGHLYGAQTTPHMFIIDPNGILIYQGAIDSKPSTDASDIPGSTNYVKAAIDEALAGKPVTDATTKAYGCSVKY